MEEIKRTRPGTGISGPFGPWLGETAGAMRGRGEERSDSKEQPPLFKKFLQLVASLLATHITNKLLHVASLLAPASPEVAMEAQGLGRAVRYGTSFDMKESELVILLTAAWTGSKAEFDIHSAEAIKAGLPPSCVSLIWSSMSSVASGRWDPSFIPALCSSVGDDGLSLLARFTCLLLEGKGEVEDEVRQRAA